jgi:hypothetical protein
MPASHEAAAASTQRGSCVTRAQVAPWKCWGSPETVGGVAARLAAAAAHGVVASTCWYLDWERNWGDFVSVDEREHMGRAAGEGGGAEVEGGGGSWPWLGGEAALWTERVDWTNVRGCCSLSGARAGYIGGGGSNGTPHHDTDTEVCPPMLLSLSFSLSLSPCVRVSPCVCARPSAGCGPGAQLWQSGCGREWRTRSTPRAWRRLPSGTLGGSGCGESSCCLWLVTIPWTESPHLHTLSRARMPC